MNKQKPSVHFIVTVPDPNTHLFHVVLRVERPDEHQQLALPAWIPGSYLIREFAGRLQCLQARQGRRVCAVHQLDKHRWQVDCTAGKPLEVTYQVHAHDVSVRTAWLDADRGFFNATSLCLMVQGQTNGPQHITIKSPCRHWELVTGLEPLRVNAHGFGLYVAPDYGTLADCPVEMGAFWSARFTACGVPHRFVIAHPLPTLDEARLVRDTRRICEATMRFWHGSKAARQAPFDRYVFMLHAVDEGYGGLEHGNSTALTASRKHLPRIGQEADADYTTVLGLISHEYFHAWNVKRLRPAAFVPYDYARENYTELLWFFEGLTSYYDDLLLLRAGCIDLNGYLQQLQKTLDSVRNCPGRHIHNVAQASFEAWTKYYRPDANTPNATVSYYAKGALIGLCLDLVLHREGKTTLDAVMRALYERCYAKAPAPAGMTEQDLRGVLQELGGRSFAREIDAWVHGTDELPLDALLQDTGIRIVKKEATLAQQWGLRCKEGASIVVQTVLRGGMAEAAGLAPGDEWLGVEVEGSGQPSAWRVGSLADVQACLVPAGRKARGGKKRGAQRAVAIVARDRRLLRLSLSIPAQPEPSFWKLETCTQTGSIGSSQDECRWPWTQRETAAPAAGS